MRVENKPHLASLAGHSVKGRASGARFAPSDSTPAQGSSHAASASLVTMDALLALQGEPDPRERKKRHAKRGQDLLEALDRLKAALLGGRVGAADLRMIAARLSERSALSGDPQLDEIVAHIELRAKVELAKLGLVTS
jgi:hypothetical protein